MAPPRAPAPPRESAWWGRGLPAAPFAVALAAILGGVAWSYSRLFPSVAAFVESIDHCHVLFCDFANHYYPMGLEILETRRPAYGFYYSPSVALAMRPFSLGTLEAGALAWGAAQALAAAALWLVPFRLLGGRRSALFLAYTAAYWLSVPLLHNLKWGQFGAAITLLLLGAFSLAERGGRAERWAGVLLALTVTVKYYTLAFAGWWLLRRRWGALAWFGGTAALLLAALPAATLGPAETLAFYREVRESVRYITHDINPNSQHFAYAVRRWIELLNDYRTAGIYFPGFMVDPMMGLAGNPRAFAWTALALGYASAAWAGLMALAAARRGGPGDAALFFVFGSLALPFALPTSWPHYFCFLPALSFLWLRRFLLAGPRPPAAWAALAALWAPATVLPTLPALLWVGSWWPYTSASPMMTADLLLLLAFSATESRALLPHLLSAPDLFRRAPPAPASLG